MVLVVYKEILVFHDHRPCMVPGWSIDPWMVPEPPGFYLYLKMVFNDLKCPQTLDGPWMVPG